MTEWHDKILIQLFRFEKGTALDATNSALYSKASFYYSRDNSDNGDIAGRIPVTNKQTYYVQMVNYDRENEHSLVLQYGGAVGSLIFSAIGFATLLATSFF